MEETLQNDTNPGNLLPIALGAMVAVVAIGLAIFSLFGRQFHLAEIVNNFRLQISVLLVFSTVLFFYLNFKVFGMVQLAGCLIYAWPVLSTFLPAEPPPVNDNAVSLLSINILGKNSNQQPVLDVLKSTDADIVLVVEYESDWIEPLKELEQTYVYHIKEPRWHGFGIALYSKHPIVESDVVYVTRNSTDNPVVFAEIEANGQRFMVVGAHFLAPMSRERMEIRNNQMTEVAALIKQIRSERKLPIVLAGDFNCVPWSSFAQGMMTKAGLRDSRQGFFYQGTFPSDINLVSIPIDHAFVSNDVHVHDRKILPANSSDHFPLLLEFSVSNDGKSN